MASHIEGALKTDLAILSGIGKIFNFFTLNAAAANPEGSLSRHIQAFNALSKGEKPASGNESSHERSNDKNKNPGTEAIPATNADTTKDKSHNSSNYIMEMSGKANVAPVDQQSVTNVPVNNVTFSAFK